MSPGKDARPDVPVYNREAGTQGSQGVGTTGTRPADRALSWLTTRINTNRREKVFTSGLSLAIIIVG